MHSRRLVEDSLASGEMVFEFEVVIIVRCVLHGWKISWVRIKTIYNKVKTARSRLQTCLAILPSMAQKHEASQASKRDL
jgi:hypothetical protein